MAYLPCGDKAYTAVALQALCKPGQLTCYHEQVKS
jgi:hypothetical protein